MAVAISGAAPDCISPETNSVLNIRGLSKRFGPLLANDDISLSLAAGEVIGLLGENGAGKSTLVSILFGHYVADTGEIEVFGKLLAPGRPDLALASGIGMVHQHFTIADNLTVLDNVLVGTESLWRWKSERINARAKLIELGLQFGLSIDPEARAADLSVGEKQRVEILKVLYRGAKILIFDEPTSVLTPQESSALFATLRKLINQGLSIIFISHKLDEVIRVSDRILVLKHGKLVAKLRASDASKKQLAELMVGASVAKPIRQNALGDLSNTRVTAPIAAPSAAPSGPPLLRLSNLKLEQPGERGLGSPINLTVHAGEIIAIAGVSGNGQRALADALMQRNFPAASRETIQFDASINSNMIARIPDDRHALGVVTDANMWENAIIEDVQSKQFTNWGLLNSRAAATHTHALIEQFDIRCHGIDIKTAKLSGGNMQKLILGRNLVRKPRVIIANQPTWGLDVGAVAFIHQQLLNAAAGGAAVLIISEDLDEVFALADRIAVMFHYGLGEALPSKQWSTQSLGLAMAGAQQSKTEPEPA